MAELTNDDDAGGASLLQPSSFDGKHTVAAQRQRDASLQLGGIVDGTAGRVGRGLSDAALHLQRGTSRWSFSPQRREGKNHLSFPITVGKIK